MVHTSDGGQRVGHVKTSGRLNCCVRFYRTEEWYEVEAPENVSVEPVSFETHVPITSIACAIPEDVAKNLLLLQGVEL